MATKLWNGGSGAWQNASNWSGGVPVSGDSVGISGGSAVAINNIFIDNMTIGINRQGTQPINLSLYSMALGMGTTVNVTGEGGPVEMSIGNMAFCGHLNENYGQLYLDMVANSSVIQAGYMTAVGGLGNSNIIINANSGYFMNMGEMDAGTRGGISVAFAGTYPTNNQVILNTGIIKSSSGGQIDFEAAHAFTRSFGTLSNYGKIDADGGAITIGADFHQSKGGITKIENGGTLNLNGVSDGGTIEITSGTLNFGLMGRSNPGPVGSEQFGSHLVLDGGSASLGFGNPSIQEVFDAAKQELLVTVPFNGAQTTIGDFHVSGPTAFSAADFSVSGSNVIFAHHAA